MIRQDFINNSINLCDLQTESDRRDDKHMNRGRSTERRKVVREMQRNTENGKERRRYRERKARCGVRGMTGGKRKCNKSRNRGRSTGRRVVVRET